MSDPTTRATAACDADPGAEVCECHYRLRGARQVGWYGPYGIIPGDMDNEPNPKWRPIYVLRG